MQETAERPLVAHLEHGILPSHLRCFVRQAMQAAGTVFRLVSAIAECCWLSRSVGRPSPGCMLLVELYSSKLGTYGGSILKGFGE